MSSAGEWKRGRRTMAATTTARKRRKREGRENDKDTSCCERVERGKERRSEKVVAICRSLEFLVG